MTAEDIVRRNRTNAARSTGPRTRAGKAKAAQNARRHGATAKLDPERVRLWVKVILAAPDVDLPAADASVGNERSVLALALAEAEARYVLAEQALRDFVSGELGRPGVIQVVAGDPGSFPDRAPAGGSGTEGQSGKREPGGRGARALDEDLNPGGRRHRLLQRYLHEAQRDRTRAFDAWVSYEVRRGGADV